MAHLSCLDHQRRCLIFPGSTAPTAIHRSDGSRCQGQRFRLGDRVVRPVQEVRGFVARYVGEFMFDLPDGDVRAGRAEEGVRESPQPALTSPAILDNERKGETTCHHDTRRLSSRPGS